MDVADFEFLKNPLFNFNKIKSKLENGIFLKFKITVQTSTARYQQ